jgi:hypothetical protein
MPCHDQQRSATRGVWSNDSTSTAVFVPFLQIPRNDFDEVRPSFLLGVDTGAVVECGYRTSQDGITWGSVTAFGPSATSTAGWSFGTAYVTPTAAARHVQFGISCKNDTGTSGVRSAQVTLQLDLRAED